MKTLKLLNEYVEVYGGEPDYNIIVKTFEGMTLDVYQFSFNSENKTFTIHTEKEQKGSN